MQHKIIHLIKTHRHLLIFVLLMVGFRSAIADWNVVPTGSMKPTIVEGDRIGINKLAYDIRIPLTHISLHKLADPQRGEIVIFESAAAHERLVKRIIGLPGDTVAMDHNRLTINGKTLDYTLVRQDTDTLTLREYLDDSAHLIRIRRGGAGMDSFAPVLIPAGHYLVLGDNRDNSADSRFIGFVPRNELIGRSSRVIMSLDYENYYLPRGDRFWRAL